MEKNSFGALPIQRISKEAAIGLLRKSLCSRRDLYDTARYYTDSEEKVGAAFEGMRDKIYIATKTGATTAEGFWKDLHTSLEKLKQTISTFTSSITRHSARSRETAQDCMKPCWKRRTKA